MDSLKRYTEASGMHGVDIKTTANLFRRYNYLERSLISTLSGWFLAVPEYEIKHQLGYRVWDHARHIRLYNERLAELRGGNLHAAIDPLFMRFADEIVNAPSSLEFLSGVHSSVLEPLLESLRDHEAALDPVANAADIPVLQQVIRDLERQVDEGATLGEQGKIAAESNWIDYLATLRIRAGGISGLEPILGSAPKPNVAASMFQRPKTIIVDDRIERSTEIGYDENDGGTFEEHRTEQFRIYFNELYAAGLLASVLFDARHGNFPWEFYYDVSHHFWDEVRHSQFGAVRLKELGFEPSRINPILFEQSESLPIEHRICYLTFGLEKYFMPRKAPRFKKYGQNRDFRSQLFSDVDWSDEINHVRIGKKWLEYFLKDDYRTEEDLLEEVKEHLSAVRGEKVEKVDAPF